MCWACVAERVGLQDCVCLCVCVCMCVCVCVCASSAQGEIFKTSYLARSRHELSVLAFAAAARRRHRAAARRRQAAQAGDVFLYLDKQC